MLTFHLQVLTLSLLSARLFERQQVKSSQVRVEMRSCDTTMNYELLTGCNVESGAYSPSVCAERTAICKAVSEGFKNFHSIAVVAFQENDFVSPCGVCRQTLSEFASTDFPVYMAKPVAARVLVTSVYRLLPYRFRSEDLKK